MRAHHILIGLLATACTPVAVTPPLRTVPLETVATAREAHVAIRASGGAHYTGWDFTGVGSGGGSYGLVEDLELQLDGGFGYIGEIDGDARRTIGYFAGAGRVGVKHAVLPWLALTGGVGAGAGPWGAYTGGDLGAIVAYENPYVVPFFAARMQLTTPIDPATETWIEESGESRVEHFLTPATVLWFQPSAGVRIPFDSEEGQPRLSLSFAVAWTSIYAFEQERDSLHGFGGEAGLSLEL